MSGCTGVSAGGAAPPREERVGVMVRVRFHGRGGHGVKTASRIVGTAAFLAGYQVQDSPVYGAERRGAPVTAFTRISGKPVLERGPIQSPDLIVIADETLLEDPVAGVLAGQEAASAVFVNAESAEGLAEKYSIRPEIIALDITGRTLEALGRASALSAGIGAAAARLTGLVSAEQLEEAGREELAHAGVLEDMIKKNVALAREIYAEVPAVTIHRGGPVAAEAAAPEMRTVAYDSPTRGAPSVIAPGNAELRQTGAWRVEMPVIDYDRCTRCGLCFVRCPDGAIALDDDGYPVIDYDHCKGCMICQQICPIHGIEIKKETEAW